MCLRLDAFLPRRRLPARARYLGVFFDCCAIHSTKNHKINNEIDDDDDDSRHVHIG